MVRALPLALALLTGTAVAVAAVNLPADDRAMVLSSDVGPVAVARVPIDQAVVRASGGGSRGPVAAALADGRVLLGGGPDGRRLLVVDPSTGTVREVGSIIRADQRRDDARFAPTDIEVMSSTAARHRLFVSYPELVASRGCVRLAVDRVDVSREEPMRVLAQRSVFRSKPCIQPNAIQHASGRLVRISANRAYVTLGDLGYPRIDRRSARGQLGSVLRIGEGVRAVRISQGHRNGQGLALDRLGRLWETEHGPAGGDELNLIRRGRDYGWPFVTLGQPYGTSDYVMPRRTGTHAGYTKPRTSWVPSVATSELVQVPGSWAGWQTGVGGDLLMGTLKDEAFWRLRVARSGRVLERERLPVGHRIRDLEVRADGTLAATTDDGTLLVLTRAG
ncbi:MAG: PQQ-dependent sugar dehydrogenase [Candidatus Nanopelagicales bacterium]|jgi:glucose/arabinose dehydrogenase|nr:PQQ-dependent sugar dehydrogenase [Candidatus Nanopelagicales bacterium]